MEDTGGYGSQMPASRELMRLMGRVVSNGEMYSPAHRLTTDAIDKCYELVVPILMVCEHVDFKVVAGALLIKDEPAGTTDSFINVLAARLTDLEVSGLSLERGLTREECGKLFEIMFNGVQVADGEGEGMRRALVEYGIEHVHVQKLMNCTITEQEEVVLKSEERTSRRRGEGVEEEREGDGGVQIMAFLKGDVTVDAAQAGKNMEAMLLSNPERLARLIMATAVVQPGEAMPTGKAESLADIVVARLDRVRRVLLKKDRVKSNKLKIGLKKNLLLLGKEILSSLHGDGAPADPGAEPAVTAAIRGMMDGLENKAIASGYAKKRASFAKAEKDLVRRIKAMGAKEAIESGLGEELSGKGVTVGDWRTLLAKAGVGATSCGEGGAVGEIVALLTKLDAMIGAGRPDADAIAGIVSQANDQAEALAGETGRKIGGLGEQIRQLDETLAGMEEPKRTKAILSRKALIELLAEIIQELSQPVAVMTSVIQMTLGGYLGPVSDQQKETLGVAAESGERTGQLLNRLIEVVGVPKGLAPDKSLIGCPPGKPPPVSSSST